jgi:hypothetical protein
MKNVIGAGLLGGVVLILWTFVANGLFGFQSRIDMRQLSAEPQVYETLKEHVRTPGRYTVNPQLTAEGRFPEGQPVFSVLYGGMGHEAAGSQMLLGLALFLLAPMVGAWMLTQTSMRVKSSYGRKVLFFSAIGLLFAIYGDLTRYGIGGYPLNGALKFAAYHIVTWTLVGLAVAWRIRPPHVDQAAT